MTTDLNDIIESCATGYYKPNDSLNVLTIIIKHIRYYILSKVGKLILQQLK